MTNKEKELLLIDLCARLPYEVIVHVVYESGETCYGKLSTLDIEWFKNSKIKTIKPYLRKFDESGIRCELWSNFQTVVDNIRHLIENHYDINHLIEKGLALEATEGMYSD